MKKMLAITMLAITILFYLNPQNSMAEMDDYKKYGNIAIAVVKADYPGDEVKDYAYMGRVKSSTDDVTDSFRFQVNEAGKPITVIVKIAHNLKNKKLLALTVEEQQP